MADEKPIGADVVDTLRAVLAMLGQHLEPFEQWRALRQLDERERNGNPLEGIDGVLFRGRLVQGLAQSSRDWRAYARIEEAIGHLQGPERLETGILKDPSVFAVEPSVAVPERAAKVDATAGNVSHAAVAEFTVVAPNGPGTLDEAASRRAGSGMQAAPNSSEATGPAVDNDALDGQRQRYKVRAGSSPLPHSPLTPIRSIFAALPPLVNGSTAPAVSGHQAVTPNDMPPPDGPRKDVPLTNVPPTNLPAVASLRPRPRPLPSQAEATVAAASAAAATDGASPRSVLQRIRVVTRTPQPQSLPPAVPEALPSLPSSAAVLPAWANIQGSIVPKNNVAGVAAPGVAENAAAAGSDKRLDDLEAELGHLIDRSASWPHPLDVARAGNESSAPSAGERVDSAGLEPDTASDLELEIEVDEAEVTIVRIAAVERAGIERQQAHQPGHQASHHRSTSDATPDFRAPQVTNGEVASEAAPRDDYAGQLLDLEEASVEIIVPEPKGPQSGAPATWDPMPDPGGDATASRNGNAVRKI